MSASDLSAYGHFDIFGISVCRALFHFARLVTFQLQDRGSFRTLVWLPAGL